MNNKGFTLIELVATVALLAILAVISFVSVNGIIKDSKIKDCETLVNNIKSATKEYVSDNRYSFTNNNAFEITTTDLVNGKYLTGPVVNPFDNSEEVTARVNVTLKSDYTVNVITVKNASGTEINCDNEEW